LTHDLYVILLYPDFQNNSNEGLLQWNPVTESVAGNELSPSGDRVRKENPDV
jgi:hypothetical protein